MPLKQKTITALPWSPVDAFPVRVSTYIITLIMQVTAGAEIVFVIDELTKMSDYLYLL